MKSEDDNFISFDDEEIDALVERHFDNAEEDEPENSGLYGNTLDTVDKSEQIDADDSLTTAHLPVALLNTVDDISNRDNTPKECVAVALFTAVSSVFSEKIHICQKRNDVSAVCAAVISPLVITDPRDVQRTNLNCMLRTLLQSHNYINLNSENGFFDFRTLVVDKRRVFSGSKIKLVKPNETGKIEAVFSADSFERRGNSVNPETDNFFVSMDEIELQSVVKSLDNTFVLNQFILLNPAPVIWQESDIAIRVDFVSAISQIFARISNTVDALGEEKLILHFSPEAQDFYFRFVKNLKSALNSSTEHPSLIAHLDSFDALFCKIALLLYLCECAAAGTQVTAECEIDLIAAERARAWCAIFEDHARRVFLNLLSKNSVENLILQKIADGRLGETFTAREIARAQWTGLRSLVEIKKALIGLVEDGKLRAITEEKGGRPSMRYEPINIEEVEVDLDSGTDEWEDR